MHNTMKKTTFLLCATLSLWGWQSAAQEQNTSCETATTISAGEAPISTPKGTWWYQLATTVDATYEVVWDGQGGEINLYAGVCGKHLNIDGGSSTFTFTVTDDDTYYISVDTKDKENISWSVLSADAIPDNRLCAYAEAVELGDTISTLTGADRWYKLAATAGKSYGGGAGEEIDGFFEVLLSCDGNFVTSGTGKFFFTASATQDYYIRAHAYRTVSWAVSEITDNRVCANAEAVELGDTISTLTGADRWYKLAATAGKSYEGGAGGRGSFIVYSSCGSGNGGSTVNGSSGDPFSFTAPATQDYYIRAYAFDDTAKWSVSEITDNRLCAYAEAIGLGDTISTPDDGDYRWYKLAATAGKSYEGGAGGGSGQISSFAVYPSCDEYPIGLTGNTFTAPVTQEYYIRVHAYIDTVRWAVSEITDNRVCANAEAIELGDTISTPDGDYRWYKLAATAGKSYEGGAGKGSGYISSFEVYSSCDGYSIGLAGNIFTAPATQEYYIRVYAYDDAVRWAVSEITDNRVCANAEPVTLNTKIPVNNESGSLWYKANVQAGKSYSVSAAQGSSFDVRFGCEEDVIAFGSSTVYFKAVGNTTVNIRRLSVGFPDTLIIREVAAADVPNTSCNTAKSIAAGQKVAFAPILMDGYLQLPDNSYYKLAVEVGKAYTIPKNSEDPYNINFTITEGCGDFIAAGSLKSDVTFTAETTGEYIIEVGSIGAMPGEGDTVRWQVDESTVAYPISCAIAKAVSVGSDIETKLAPGVSTYTYYYYKLSSTFGNAYEIAVVADGKSYEIKVYDGCGNKHKTLDSEYNDTLTFIPPSSGDYYIALSSSRDFSWRINESVLPVATNTTCAAAEQMQLSNPNSDDEDELHIHSALLTEGQERWYKVDATEGRYYFVAVLEASNEEFGFAVYTSCGGGDPVATSGEGEDALIYRAQQTGTAYFKLTGSGAVQFVAAEVAEGNGRMCEVAIPVELDDSVRSESNKGLWYSIAAEPGYLYTISNIPSDGNYYVSVYDGCGNRANQLAFGYGGSGNPATFSVSSAKTCYIEYDNSSPNPQTWIVTREAVEDNRICSNAEPAQLGGPDTTTLQTGETRWYSFSGVAGKMYEISGSALGVVSAELYYGSSCEELHNSYGRYALLAGEGKSVYFGWKAFSGSGDFAWTITELAADNRLCAYAESVDAGDTIQTTLAKNVSRWYKFNVQSGRTYEILGSNNSAYSLQLSVQSGTCDNFKEIEYESVYSNSSISLLFQPEESGVYYIEYHGDYSAVSGYALSWQLREVTENTFCANASPVEQNTQVSNTHKKGGSLWYAFTAPEAGAYSITSPAEQALKVWTSCEGSTLTATSSGAATFTAEAGATYYIEWLAAGSYEYSYKWSISKYEPAALTALSVLGYPLSPTFAPYTATYRVNLPYRDSSVTIIAEALSEATITGDTGVHDALSVRENTFTVTVAASGSSTSYTIIVYRAPLNASSADTLSALTVSAGTLTPAFSPSVTAYTVSVGYEVSRITIAATAADERAFVSDTGTHPLNVGANSFSVTVTAEDGEAERTYSIVVTRAAPEVESVAVTPAAVSVQKGATQQFAATVTVTGSLAQEVTWSIAGNSSASTTIDSTGLLTVAADEAAATLTVTATSIADNTKSDSATVTVTATNPETGVESQLTAAVKLYPNPFTGVLHLSGAEGCTLRVINASGTAVHIRLLTSSDEAVQLGNLPAGLYFFHLEKDGKSKTLQAVKQ
jgi:hypothetical protein